MSANAVKLTKQAIIDAIESGVVKNKRNPHYDEEKGTLIEKFNVSQAALKELFENNKDLQAAYNRRFPSKGNTAVIRYDSIQLVDDDQPDDQPVVEEVEEVEEVDEDII